MTKTEFVWGQTDCGLWIADQLHLYIGRDVCADLRGQYSDAAGCAETLTRVYGSTELVDVVAIIAVREGWQEIAPGDDWQVAVSAVWDRFGGVAVIGRVVDGTRIWSAMTRAGERDIPARALARAWRVA